MPSFAVPGLAVAGALAVSIPIIIHILSRRPRKPEPWAAMRFLLAAYRKHRMRTRLEQWILLAVRCLLLLLLGFALAEPAWSALKDLTGLGAGRTVVVILDDSITSGAADAPGHTRLSTLKDAADKLLGTLGPGDRAALITVSRPARALIAPPTADPMAVRNQIRELTPTPSAADLPGALRLAKQALEDDRSGGAGRGYIVLLSDLSAGAVAVRDGAALGPELSGMDQSAVLLHSAPLPGAPNVQVAAFEPDRRVVVARASGERPIVTWNVRLRRFSDGDLPAAAATVRLRVLDAQPVRRTVSFDAGQAELDVPIATPLFESGLISATVSLEPGPEGADALTTDDTRYATVIARQRLSVTIVSGEGSPESGQAFTPRRWLATALAPVSDRLGWPIDVTHADAPNIGSAAADLSETDAVVILRPDLLTDEGFSALRRWADAGGLVFFASSVSETASAVWSQRLVTAFDLPWSVGQTPIAHETPLRLKVDIAPVGELEKLSADLPDLLRPVEVFKRFEIDPASLGSEAETLLVSEGGAPILIARNTESGRGRVMLLATAIDTEWTNLPAKPLFVPLLHETLRHAIDRFQPPQEYEPGDQPALDPRWENTPRLTAPDGEGLLLVRDRGSGDQPAAGPVRPIRPFEQVGVHKNETDALVVNINADAGDTRSPDADAVRTLLDSAGQWQPLDTADPGAVLLGAAPDDHFAWPLLWVVLALALIETLLARRVSHANTAAHATRILDTRRAAA